MSNIRQHITALIGDDKAELFFNEYGGLYFEMSKQNKAKLQKLLGRRETVLLALMLGNDVVYIPMNAYEQTQIRHQAIINRLIELMTHHKKKQATKLTAKEFGISERWVQILFNRYKQSKANNRLPTNHQHRSNFYDPY